jgi:dTMP kinase
LTVLLDVDVEVGLKRRKQNEMEWNRMDAHEIAFYQRVRKGYLEMVKQEPKRWVVVNAGQKWESVQEELRKAVVGRLK